MNTVSSLQYRAIEINAFKQFLVIVLDTDKALSNFSDTLLRDSHRMFTGIGIGHWWMRTSDLKGTYYLKDQYDNTLPSLMILKCTYTSDFK